MSSVIIRRDVLDRAGGFDPGLFGSEDREWFLRIAAVAPVYTVGVPLSGYRDTPGSLCKDAGVREPVMLEVLRRVDRQGLWRRRWLLRRKAYSYVHHSLAVVHAWAGNHGGAVKQELKSLAWFPLPYRRDEVNTPFARPKRLAVNLLRLARLKGADRGAAAKPVPAVNALQKLLQNGDRAAPAQSSPGPSCF